MNTNGTVKIIIPGRGPIPRLGGLGPKLVPSDVEFATFEAIVTTRGAAPCSVIDTDGGAHPATRMNYRDLFAAYSTNGVGAAEVKAAKKNTPTPKKEEKAADVEEAAPEEVVNSEIPVDDVDETAEETDAVEETTEEAPTEEKKEEAPKTADVKPISKNNGGNKNKGKNNHR